MLHQYLILIDKRDYEKFRRFKIGKFNAATKDILVKNNSKFIWGFHKGQITNSWKNVQKNDRVFFSIPNNKFEITSQVGKKIIDKRLGKILWPNELNSQNITHFLLFDTIQKTNLLFTQTLDNTIKKIKIPLPGIYELKKKFKVDLNIPSSESNTNKPRPKAFTISDINKMPVPKKSFEVTRFLRDPKKVKKIKEMYCNKCQICGYTFEYEKNKFYSEVHHYNPLKASADDELDNMVVVCPNHHAEFDYNVIAINSSGTGIIDRYGKEIGTIRFKSGHKLNRKNINSQLDNR